MVKEGETIAQYTYDSEDNILTVKDADDNVITLSYDLLNRPKTVKEPGKTAYTGKNNRVKPSKIINLLIKWSAQV